MQKAVFFDRDGVLNEAIVVAGKPYPPKTLAEFVIKKDAKTALDRLKQAGYVLLVVTNQPDVARGTTTKKEIECFNRRLMEALPLHQIYTCYHDDRDHCDCRKPLPGLFFQAAKAFDLDLCQSFMIGDRWRDIEAGTAAGCQNIWFDYHYAEKEPTGYVLKTDSLTKAVDFILGVKHESK